MSNRTLKIKDLEREERVNVPLALSKVLDGKITTAGKRFGWSKQQVMRTALQLGVATLETRMADLMAEPEPFAG
jgi:hypothetical protein